MQTMSKPIRNFAPGTTLEITTRTFQSRFLLRPSTMINLIVIGVLAKAAKKYDILVHAFFFMSNHYHLIITIPSVQALARFMNYVNSNIAKKAGRWHKWRGAFWGRRYRAIPILDDEALVDRLRHTMEQGCKEGLIADPRNWPGATCVSPLLEGKPARGFWFSHTKEWYARRAGKKFDDFTYADEQTIQLTPIPCWADLSEEQYRDRILEMVKEIARDTKAMHRKKGTRPLGAHRILKQRPHAVPRTTKRSPAPSCHAYHRKLRKLFRRQYRAFVDVYRDSSREFLAGKLDVEFPPFCFRPPLTFMTGSDPTLVPT